MSREREKEEKEGRRTGSQAWGPEKSGTHSPRREPHPGALPVQESLEGHAHREVGAAGAHSLQDTGLVQLLCHVPHIEEAWELWPETEPARSGVKGFRTEGEGPSRAGYEEFQDLVRVMGGGGHLSRVGVDALDAVEATPAAWEGEKGH